MTTDDATVTIADLHRARNPRHARGEQVTPADAEAKRMGLEACRASGAAPGGVVYAQIAAIAAPLEAL